MPGNMGSCLATTQDEQQERWGSSSPPPGEAEAAGVLSLASHWSPVGVWEAAPHPRVPLALSWELHTFSMRAGLPCLSSSEKGLWRQSGHSSP